MDRSPSAAERRHFILHHGILRYGLPLGLLVFAFIAQGEYASALERLATPAGWLRLLILLLLCLVAEGRGEERLAELLRRREPDGPASGVPQLSPGDLR
jgi:hypothetical protein